MNASPDLVLHSCTSRSFSGLERYVLDLLVWQHRHGKPVEFFCREGTQLEAEARAQGIPVWVVPEKLVYGPRLWLKMAGQWAELARSRRITLHMHAGGESWYHFPWLLARGLGAKSGLAKTILQYHIWINHRKTGPFHRLRFRGIDEIWASSESARAHLASILPVDRDHIRVMSYGRDVRALTEIPQEKWRAEERARLGLKNDDVLAVCVSRIEPIKGVGELFDAFVELAPRMPKAHLAIVGDISPDNEEAAQFWKSLEPRYLALPTDIKRRLYMPGYVSDCRPILAASDFYVLPSYEECMSLALLDALIMGLPAIGTNSGGTPSVARPGETGLLVPPRDKGALKAAMEKMYSDGEMRTKLSGAARTLGQAFDREQIFEKIWEAYNLRK